jgi:hypothetical protein
MLCIDDLFKGRHFDPEIIILCVRWYLRFKLSFRDLVEMMAERGLSLAHTTIMRWVHRFVPEFEKRWNRFARQSDGSWQVDETYVKIKGRWTQQVGNAAPRLHPTLGHCPPRDRSQVQSLSRPSFPYDWRRDNAGAQSRHARGDREA